MEGTDGDYGKSGSRSSRSSCVCARSAASRLNDGKVRIRGLDTCMELLLNGTSAGHKILLFSQFTSMLEIIAKRTKRGIRSCLAPRRSGTACRWRLRSRRTM